MWCSVEAADVGKRINKIERRKAYMHGQHAPAIRRFIAILKMQQAQWRIEAKYLSGEIDAAMKGKS